jgi:tetratricopeptide (TPR) repeat protein
MPQPTDRPTGTSQQWTEEPFGLVRLVVGAVALLGTVVAIILAVLTRDLRMLELVGAVWAVYGLTLGFLYGVLDPVIDGFFRLMSNVGLTRAGSGYSAMETLVARGHFKAAAEAYAEAARNDAERVEATLRRAALLAGPLGEPETAAVELDSLRAARLSSRDDFRIGLALIDLFEHQLQDPGRAMGELRRLIDRYPTAQAARRLRVALRELKAQRQVETRSP